MKSRFQKTLFNLWYLRHPPWDTGIPPPELAAFTASRPPGRALDIGCGTGTNVIFLSQNGWQATGVDFAAQAIRRARRKAIRAGLSAHFLVDDATRLGRVSGLFDLILDMGCFHGLPPAGQAAYTAHISRLLAPGGTFMLYAIVAEGGPSTFGVDEQALALLTSTLTLTRREDGTNRGKWPSAWFWFAHGAADRIPTGILTL